jgi:hypothetical protein
LRSGGFEFEGEDDDGNTVTSGVLFYQSSGGLGINFFEIDEGLVVNDWTDIEQEAGEDLPDGVNLESLVTDFYLNSSRKYGAIVTGDLGIYFLNERTVDELSDLEEPGEDETALEILEKITTLKSIGGFGSDNVVQAVEAANNGQLVLFGTDRGVYRLIIGNESVDGKTYPAPVDGNGEVSTEVVSVSVASRLRVQELVANSDGSKVAALFGNGTIEVYNVSGSNVTLAATRPFYAGLPGAITYDNSSQVYQSSITGMAWSDDDELYVVGPDGVVKWSP